jgi:predicted DNA-binding transcriptional regulator AlpA
MHPPTCRALGAEPTDPTLIGRTRKRRWQEGGTHSLPRLMSAESQLGTLPVSLLTLRALHTRSGLGRSAVLRHTHSNDVPEPTDPTHVSHTCKRRWQEGGTHKYARLVSAESELGTLPVSLLSPRSLHTQSGLGRSAVLRRTNSNHVPLQVPVHCTHREGCPLSTP